MITWIKGGRVVDPGRFDGPMDILVEDGLIKEVTEALPEETKERVDQVIDAKGRVVVPGLIDMHVHLREPGHEYKETIETGVRAAARGGFTAVCAMPNTSPVNDNRQVTEYIIQKAKEAGAARVFPVGAISCNLSGTSLSEFGELIDAGAVAVTDDGLPVKNALFMRRALEYAKGFDLPVISHCEELDLAGGGSMNEGAVANRMGLSGIPNISESIMVMRDISLAELTGGAVHIAHVSTEESVEIIREAKKRGVRVTAETAPHYFTLTEEAVSGYDTHAKMNPPLRTERDRQAIIEGLSDGTLDVIATDHAPHSVLEKDLEFDAAANGIVGLETSLPLSLALVDQGVLNMEELVKRMSTNPAEILGLSSTLAPGSVADITVIDPDAEWVVDASKFLSKGRNTPFDGRKVTGKAVLTMVGGRVVHSDF